MSDGPQKLPPKKEVALALLEGPSMYVHMDPRRQGVLVPKRFLDKAQLVLQIGLNMFIPIPDLTVDDEGISCTLSFDRAPFQCRMPWNAIYALVGEDGRGMMWPSDIPPEVVAQMQQSPPPSKEAVAAKPQPKRPRGKLSAVGDAPPEPEVKAPATEENTAEAKVAPPALALAPEPTPAPEPAVAEAAERDEPKDGGTQAPSGPQASPAGGRKPKRELPPYLRVIK
jgi:stringent starvation protein B